jgi:hypothetical protein
MFSSLSFHVQDHMSSEMICVDNKHVFMKWQVLAEPCTGIISTVSSHHVEYYLNLLQQHCDFIEISKIKSERICDDWTHFGH